MEAFECLKAPEHTVEQSVEQIGKRIAGRCQASAGRQLLIAGDGVGGLLALTLSLRIPPGAFSRVVPVYPVLDLQTERASWVASATPAARATIPRRSEQPACIIFASAATGQPQGVEVSAASLVAHFGSHNQVLRFTQESRALSLAPFHVDVSILDTLLPLSVGAFVVQFRNLPAGAVIRAVLAREHITHLVLHAFGPPEATIFSLTYQVDQAGPGQAPTTAEPPTSSDFPLSLYYRV